MNFLAFLTAIAESYDAMAKGGAKVEADKLLSAAQVLLAALAVLPKA
jgi:hypothetical protein